MWDERVNRAIDEAARRMTEGSPPVEFRRRILARIEAGDAPRRSWRILFVLPPIAAAVAIAIAVFVARNTDRAEQARPRREPTAATASAGRTVAGAELAAPETTSRREPTGTTAGAGRTVTAAELAPPEARPRRQPAWTAALAGAELAPPSGDQPAIDPLDVAPLTVGALGPDPIQIERLETIAPMTVAPLDITDPQRRDP